MGVTTVCTDALNDITWLQAFGLIAWVKDALPFNGLLQGCHHEGSVFCDKLALCS